MSINASTFSLVSDQQSAWQSLSQRASAAQIAAKSKVVPVVPASSVRTGDRDRLARFSALVDDTSDTMKNLSGNRDRARAVASSLRDVRAQIENRSVGGSTAIEQRAVMGRQAVMASRDSTEERDIMEQRDVFETRDVYAQQDVFETRDTYTGQDVYETRDVFATQGVFETRDVYETRNIVETRNVTQTQAVYENRDVKANSLTGTRSLKNFGTAAQAGIATTSELKIQVGGDAAATITFGNEQIKLKIGTGVTQTFNYGGGDDDDDDDDDEGGGNGAWRTALVQALNKISGLDASINSAGKLVVSTEQGQDLTLTNTRNTPLSALGLTAGPHAGTVVRTEQVQVGTREVVTGTQQVVTGTQQVKTGTQQVQVGTQQVKTGTQQVKTGTVQVKTGSDQVKTGTVQVKTGTEQVKTGVEQVKTGSQTIVTGTEEYIAGFEDVIIGYEQVAVGGSERHGFDKKAVAQALKNVEFAAQSGVGGDNLLTGGLIATKGMGGSSRFIAGSDFSLGGSLLKNLGDLTEEQALSAIDAAISEADSLGQTIELEIGTASALSDFSKKMSDILGTSSAPESEDEAVSEARRTSQTLAALPFASGFGFAQQRQTANPIAHLLSMLA